MNEKPGDTVRYKYGNCRLHLRHPVTRENDGRPMPVTNNDCLLVIAVKRFPMDGMDDVLVMSPHGLGWLYADNLVPVDGPSFYK